MNNKGSDQTAWMRKLAAPVLSTNSPRPVFLCQGPYGKCSKISNTFLFLFSNNMLVIRAGTHKMSVRIASSEDPDQTASLETV